MGLYRDETGRLVELDDKFAEARGYAPSEPIDLGSMIAQKGEQQRGEERGVIGDVNAVASGFASGMTLGGSDVLLGNTLPPLERQRLQSELEAHPYERAGGEIAGATLGAFAEPGGALAKTPTGYLSATAGRAVEAGLEQGGVVGTAKALGVMGFEGAVQNAGQYLGHAAIEDKEVTAEGLSGAVGHGFEFGVVGGGAALGVTRGVVAARRMFSRVMGGEKAAANAASAWSQASEEALQADIANAQAAETKLNEIRKAKVGQQRYRNEARSMAEEERIRASGVPEQAGPAGETSVSQTSSVRPEDIGPQPLAETTPAKGGMPTSVFKKAEEAVGPTPLDEGIAAAEGGQVTSVKAPTTKKILRPEPAPKGEPTDLEAQLAGTKAQLDEGASLRDIRARPEEGLPDVRYKATEELLGKEVAKEEERLINAVEEYHAARADFEQVMERGQKTAAASPGKRNAVEILDSAHEEALLHAGRSTKPAEIGAAVTEADQFEKLLEHLSVPRVVEKGQPLSRGELKSANADEWIKEMMADAAKVDRYEKASAKLADELGDQAHPVSSIKTAAYRNAESEAERKMYDRSARAVDDAETFGPEYKTPKERVRYARERQLEEQRKLDALGVQEKEAAQAHQEAKGKVKVGEKAKKAALREDAKAAKAASTKTGTLGMLTNIAGLDEIMDIPGMPKPSDLPVIGPLLGAYLKYRTWSRAMGRMMGKVSATADTRVAVLASQTRDRVARAVDRSLGVLEKGGKYATRIAPPVAGILAHRIYDDGEPDAQKGASVQKQAAARIRELAAYVNTPNAIEKDIRFQLRDVTDPDLIAAAEQHRRALMEYLLSKAPKAPEQGMLQTVDWEPSGAEAMSFARRLDAASDPAGVWERVAQENGMLSLEAAEVLRERYPRLFGEAQQRVMEHAAEQKLKVPYRQRVQLTLLYKLPLDASLDPDNIKITQSVYERKVMNPQPGAPASPPVPSIAGPVRISQAFTNAADRR